MAIDTIRAAVDVTYTQLSKMFVDMRYNGIPWHGDECRSIMAGLSGLLYALPALVCPSPLEKCMWVLQAFFSVWADYIHIHQDHIAHGLDRIFASAMTARMIAVGASRLQPWFVVIAALPLGSFSRAHIAKSNKALDAWKFWHFMWHCTGSLSVLLTAWVVHTCEATHIPDARASLLALEAACL